MKYVSVKPFADKFEELKQQGITSTVICMRLDWTVATNAPYRKGRQADISRLNRALGLQVQRTNRNGKLYITGGPTKKVREDVAKLLCEAMNLSYNEVGL